MKTIQVGQMTWKDVTSYSRDEKDRVPRIWELDGLAFRISVHRYANLPGWYVSCPRLDIERATLKTIVLEEALREGVNYIRSQLDEMIIRMKRAGVKWGDE